MSCRHSLANGTCTECYPDTGRITPQGSGDSLDGPGARPREEVEARPGDQWMIEPTLKDVVTLLQDVREHLRNLPSTIVSGVRQLMEESKKESKAADMRGVLAMLPGLSQVMERAGLTDLLNTILHSYATGIAASNTPDSTISPEEVATPIEMCKACNHLNIVHARIEDGGPCGTQGCSCMKFEPTAPFCPCGDVGCPGCFCPCGDVNCPGCQEPSP